MDRILGGMPPEESADDVSDGLLPALEVIEQQPLAARADSYAALLDTLARRLDSAPGSA